MWAKYVLSIIKTIINVWTKFEILEGFESYK